MKVFLFALVISIIATLSMMCVLSSTGDIVGAIFTALTITYGGAHIMVKLVDRDIL